MAELSPVVPRAGRAGVRRLRSVVLELVWRHESISRADISRITGRSRSTVSEVVAELLDTGLIRETGRGRSRGGRRPVILGFRDDARVILGVDIGATRVSVALTDLRGRVLVWESRDHDVRQDPEGAETLLDVLCDRVLAARPPSAGDLMGIGIGVPSPVDPKRLGRTAPHILPAWRGRDAFEVLGARRRVPVYVDHAANFGAVAEQWWGEAAGSDHLMYVKVGGGVEAGIVVNGAIYRGATGVAGEIGHVVVDGSGPPCVCGSRGCLQTFVGGRAMVARTRSLLGRYPESALAGVEPLEIEAVVAAAAERDPLALAVTTEAARYLGTALAGIVNLMNLESIVVGGQLGRLGEQLIVPLREAMRSKTLVGSAAACRIAASRLGAQSVALGAATHVLLTALADPRLFRGVLAERPPHEGAQAAEGPPAGAAGSVATA